MEANPLTALLPAKTMVMFTVKEFNRRYGNPGSEDTGSEYDAVLTGEPEIRDDYRYLGYGSKHSSQL